jgi:iron complex outermembrane recepter protein
MDLVLKKCALALAVVTSSYAAAQDRPVLEEVVVTAQLRNESLQDVPVSVNAISGEKLMSAGISKIEDLQAYVPNLTMSETAIGTNIYIRGIGSGINQGFEQSVGMYVDGTYHGRAQLSRAPFLDLERVEVLRGPQNILYGKNSIAGAISIITAKPADNFEGMISATYEPDANENIVDLMLTGPLTEDIGARFAYRNRTMDGFVENVLGNDEPNRDEQTARLTLRWDVTSDIDATLKVERSDFDVEGRQIELVEFRPSMNANFNGADWSEILVGMGAPAGTQDTQLDHKRAANGDTSENTTDNVTLTVNVSLGDYTLTSITAGLQYDYTELCDCDFTGADLFFVESVEDYAQVSQELRIASPVGETLEWIAGLYYQDSELEFGDRFLVSNDSILPQVLDTLFSLSPTLGPYYPAGTAEALRGITVPRYYKQDTELWSVFLQTTWNVTDSLHLTFGGRYSAEEKEARRALTVFDTNGMEMPIDTRFTPNTHMGMDYLLGRVFNMARHDLSSDRDKNNFAPLIGVEFDINEDMMTYAVWTQGFKSGGFDVRSNAPNWDTPIGGISSALEFTVPAGAFEYEEEEAENIEIGIKSSLAGGVAELNVAYFYTQYDDLQVSIFDGVLGFNVGNAAKAVSQGIELDGRWLVTEGLTLSGSLAWLDFEFEEYANGQCTQIERINNPQNMYCDYEGKTNQYVADWSGALSAEYVYAIGDTLLLTTTLDVNFTTDYNPSQNLDPNIEQDGYAKLNARIALADSAAQWEVALVGKNLTDEEIITYANDTPLSTGLTQSIGYYAFVEPGTTVAIQGTLRF